MPNCEASVASRREKRLKSKGSWCFVPQCKRGGVRPLLVRLRALILVSLMRCLSQGKDTGFPGQNSVSYNLDQIQWALSAGRPSDSTGSWFLGSSVCGA